MAGVRVVISSATLIMTKISRDIRSSGWGALPLAVTSQGVRGKPGSGTSAGSSRDRSCDTRATNRATRAAAPSHIQGAALFLRIEPMSLAARSRAFPELGARALSRASRCSEASTGTARIHSGLPTGNLDADPGPSRDLTGAVWRGLSRSWAVALRINGWIETVSCAATMKPLATARLLDQVMGDDV